MPDHSVTQGESLASIAYERGLYWETVWGHPNNAELRGTRTNPNVMSPGDVIFVPDREEKEVAGGTEERHRFRRKGVPEKLRIRLLDENDEPRADIPYALNVGGKLFSGRTDANGMIEHSVPPDANGGRLEVGESGEEQYQLQLGHLDPEDGVRGAQARLRNLGFYRVSAEVNGEMDTETVAAIREFQEKNDLPVTGELDDATRDLLRDSHGS